LRWRTYCGAGLLRWRTIRGRASLYAGAMLLLLGNNKGPLRGRNKAPLLARNSAAA
jgi:hypothetical protein